MKVLVVLPSFNERENIVEITKDILSQDTNFYVCIVDDNSPDYTADVIREFLKSSDNETEKRVHLIVREKKDGRGSAVRTGIQWGIENSVNFGAFIEMDCDYSHPPTDIKKGLDFLRKADVVMGSRYPDGTIIGWPIGRRIFSFLANLLARTLISWSIADYTNGYRFYSKKAASYMCQISQKHKGYIYLSETLTYFLKKEYTIFSFPIVFVNRERGKSNTNIKEILSAFTGILSLAWLYRFGPRI